jgi:hypothetical protein
MLNPVMKSMRSVGLGLVLSASLLPLSIGAAIACSPPSSELVTAQNTAQVGTRKVKRIQFAPGKSSATVQNAVVRGDRDVYLLGAQKGQTMTVTISAVEQNAAFDIVTPPDAQGKRRTLKQEATTWKGTLPATGDYQVVVGGTRGNATYKLTVTIK